MSCLSFGQVQIKGVDASKWFNAPALSPKPDTHTYRGKHERTHQQQVKVSRPHTHPPNTHTFTGIVPHTCMH